MDPSELNILHCNEFGESNAVEIHTFRQFKAQISKCQERPPEGEVLEVAIEIGTATDYTWFQGRGYAGLSGSTLPCDDGMNNDRPLRHIAPH